MVQITGKYERTSAENYEELLKALDVNYLLRKAATASTPQMEVTEENGKWKMLTTTTLKSMCLEFELDKEFEEKTPDGRVVSSIVTKEGDNKFVCTQTAKKDGEKSTKSIREFFDDKLVYTIEIIGSDLKCTQEFKRL